MTSTGTRPLGAACAATYDGGVTRIVLANQEILDAPQGTWTDTVQVTLPAGEVRVLTQTIRAGAGSAYECHRALQNQPRVGGSKPATPFACRYHQSLLLSTACLAARSFSR